MAFTFRTPHGTVHEVDADDPCRPAVSSLGELVCPVHTGVQRPRSRRACEVRGLRLCSGCLRGTVPLRSVPGGARDVCDGCPRAGIGVGAGGATVPGAGGGGAPEGAARFAGLWTAAVACGLAVFVLDEHAPYWGALVSAPPTAGPDTTAQVRFTWFDDWRRYALRDGGRVLRGPRAAVPGDVPHRIG